jgi:hypothetical protein
MEFLEAVFSVQFTKQQKDKSGREQKSQSWIPTGPKAKNYCVGRGQSWWLSVHSLELHFYKL